MKEGYLKAHWFSLLITIGFIVASIVYRQEVAIVAAVAFVLVMISSYIRFDSELNKYDDWWSKQEKQIKAQAYEQYK